MRHILLLGVLLSAINAYSQSAESSSKSIQIDLQSDAFRTFYRDHGFAIGPLSPNAPVLPDFFAFYPTANPNDIDPVSLGIQPSEHHKHFRLGESGNVIIFFNKSKVIDLYERYLLISNN